MATAHAELQDGQSLFQESPSELPTVPGEPVANGECAATVEETDTTDTVDLLDGLSEMQPESQPFAPGETQNSIPVTPGKLNGPEGKPAAPEVVVISPASDHQGASASDQSMTPESPAEKHAIVTYAQAKGVDTSQVTLDIVAKSPEGLIHWSCVGKDLGARGPVYQQFRRAIVHEQFAGGIYPDLDEPLKEQFRQRWHLRNNFQFTSEKKIITHTHEKKEADDGEMLTKYQIRGGFRSGIIP